MRIETLNGWNDYEDYSFNGLSRVDPMNGLSRVNLNGLSRVNLNGLSRVNLNGFSLNGYELNEYIDYCKYNSIYPTMDGLQEFTLNGRAERQARKTARQERRQDRKDERLSRRQDRKDAKSEIRAERGSAWTEIAQDLVGKAGSTALELGEGVVRRKLGIPGQMTKSFGDDAETKGLFSPPSLFKDPGKWFSSNKVPTWQKVGVVGGGVVLIDALTGGNIILQRVGLMDKPKGKRK